MIDVVPIILNAGLPCEPGLFGAAVDALPFAESPAAFAVLAPAALSAAEVPALSAMVGYLHARSSRWMETFLKLHRNILARRSTGISSEPRPACRPPRKRPNLVSLDSRKTAWKQRSYHVSLMLTFGSLKRFTNTNETNLMGE